MGDLTGEAAKRFKKALYILIGLLVIFIITIIVLQIVLKQIPKGDADDDGLIESNKKRLIISKCVFILTCFVLGIIFLIISMFIGKSTVLKGKDGSKIDTKQDWNSSLWNTVAKMGSTIVIFLSLKLATFITKSIIKTQADKEFKKTDNYKFMILFVIIWIICLLLCSLGAVFAYSFYLNRNNNLDWPIMKYIETAYSTFISNFDPNSIILFIGFGILILFNFILMIYYIETKEGDNIVADKASDKIDEDADNEGDGEEEMDSNGIGFIYNLIDMIGQLDIVISLLIIWIIDCLR
jgi:ABC-type Fe3+ transport system permease subunit